MEQDSVNANEALAIGKINCPSLNKSTTSLQHFGGPKRLLKICVLPLVNVGMKWIVYILWQMSKHLGCLPQF